MDTIVEFTSVCLAYSSIVVLPLATLFMGLTVRWHHASGRLTTGGYEDKYGTLTEGMNI